MRSATPAKACRLPERGARHGEIRDYLPNSRSAGHRVGLPSDDSQLAFWTLESLLEREGLDLDDLSARFAAREIFGAGQAMEQFLRNREQDSASWYRCGAESAGNGALMRIAPIVLLHPQGTSAALWLDVALASIVTHRDASSVASCVAFVDLLAHLLRLPAPPTSDWIIATFLATVRQVCADPVYRPRGGTFAAREGTFPDYLEFVLAEAKRHDWSAREACDGLVAPGPTCSKPCRACSGSWPGTRMTRKKRSFAPSTTRRTTTRSRLSSAPPSARCTARTRCPPPGSAACSAGPPRTTTAACSA